MLRRPAIITAVLAALLGACGNDSADDGGPDAGAISVDASEGGGGDVYDQLEPELQELFDLINEERAAHGVDPVTLRADLVCAAQRHSDDVGPEGLCQHEGTDGSEFFERVSDCGGSLGAGGETIACGAPTPRGAVDSWLGSDAGHREMMLGADRRDVGVGVADDYWTAVWAD